MHLLQNSLQKQRIQSCFSQLASRGGGQGETELSEVLYSQNRRNVSLPHGSGTEALWELGSRAGPAPPAEPPANLLLDLSKNTGAPIS